MMMLAVAGLVLVILFFLNVTLPITVTFLYMLSVLAALLLSRHRLLVWKRNNESTEHPIQGNLTSGEAIIIGVVLGSYYFIRPQLSTLELKQLFAGLSMIVIACPYFLISLKRALL